MNFMQYLSKVEFVYISINILKLRTRTWQIKKHLIKYKNNIFISLFSYNILYIWRNSNTKTAVKKEIFINQLI